jgi:hypothetical protein
MSGWPKFFLFVIVGYLSMSRSFAYLGIPPARLFIGEMMIGAFLFSRPRAIFDRLLFGLAGVSPIGGFALMFGVSLAYGVFEVLRGVARGYPTVLALQGFAFHYYPICFLLGIWAVSEDATILRRVIRAAAWVNGIYGLLFTLFLSGLLIALPGTVDVRLFGQPEGSAIVLLGLICLEPRLGRVWHLLLLNAFVMLGLQVRAEYLGFFVGLAVWGLLSGRVGRLAAGAGVVAALLTVGALIDFRIPAPASRGGQISTRDIIGRVIAPVDEDLAETYSQSAKTNAGTASWRTAWWSAIWEKVHQSNETALIGEGYGYPLANLVGYHERDIRTPHNVFFYALAYGGWAGVFIFAGLQASVAQILWRAFRQSGNPLGLTLWAAFFSGALFGNAFETPFGAIPFYLLIGMAAAPAMSAVRHYARPFSPQLLSAARR